MQDHFNSDRLLSRSEVQTTFGLSQRFLEVAAIKGGGPPMVKIGRNVRYLVSDLRDWIEAQRVNSTSESGGSDA
jgi:predicted DNA-binding transcriptional regulator AlpA